MLVDLLSNSETLFLKDYATKFIYAGHKIASIDVEKKSL